MLSPRSPCTLASPPSYHVELSGCFLRILLPQIIRFLSFIGNISSFEILSLVVWLDKEVGVVCEAAHRQSACWAFGVLGFTLILYL